VSRTGQQNPSAVPRLAASGEPSHPAAVAGRAPYTPASVLYTAKPLHRPRLMPLNGGVLCLLASAGLTLIGVIAIGTTEPDLARRQVVFALVAVVGAALATIPSPRHLRAIAWPLYGFTLILLVFVLIPAVPDVLVRPRNGSRRWINLGVVDFQPSELAKIAYILVLACWLRTREQHRNLLGLIPPFILCLIPMSLILVEPDLGTALLFVPGLFAVLIAAGARKRHIGAIVGCALIIAPLSYPVLEPHQRDRIDAMIAQIRGDDRYEQDIGFQGSRAMTLVGSGGIAGVGGEHAEALIRYNGLPEEHTDMIFAVICCRWGLLGGLTIWSLFLLYALGGLLIAAFSREPFSRLVAVGFTTLLIVQMIINTGMTIGLLPITGVTLPFISYGGSSLVVTWIMTGLLYGLGLRRGGYLVREQFEFDGAST